jgi:hypothetical protein
MFKENKFAFVFNGTDSQFPSAIFTDKVEAVNWIVGKRLTGILNKYPLDISLYDWAIKESLFHVKNENQTKPKFIQSFTCAAIEHWHFDDGVDQDE